MDVLDTIYDKVYCELDEISKKEKLDSKDVELIDKFVDIIKDIEEMGVSQEMGYSNMNNYGSYANGNGYSRGGRYARGGSYGRSYGRGSYGNNGGYSRGDSKEMMLDHLERIVDMATDEKDRKAVERLMQQIESR